LITLKVQNWMPTEQHNTDFPQRVMLMIHSMRGGGSERQMSYIANEVATRSETSLVTLDESGNDAYALDARIQRIGLNMASKHGGFFRGLVANVQRIRRIRRCIQNWKPNVVLSFCDSTNVLTLIACPSSIPVIISERSDPRHQRLSPIWERLRTRYYPKCSACVSQTDDVGKYLSDQRLVTANQLKVIPSAIHIPDLNIDSLQNRRDELRPKTLIYVGRLAAEKRVDRLLQAWSELRELHSTWQLRLVGDGPERDSLQRLAADLGIESSVQWSLWSDDVWSLLRGAHAYCLVSQYEGFPQSMLEAMGAGLPVAVLDCSPAIRQTITDQVNGLVISSPEDIGNILRHLLADSSLQESLGRHAFMRAKDFEWSAIAPQWLAVLTR
jgi:GalNAc-alpha-(1->4)-GalNAc-alpha-(1->3)-diNAcBac-PP-undecaprenol alpha-1,4-N-acetyl-D-galactosaminyltransferase